MQRGIFQLTGFDESGVMGPEDRRRLVCSVASGGKMAIWGKDGTRRNIDAVLAAGLPCTVECDYTEPNEDHAQKFGHKYWAPEDWKLAVLPK